MADTLIKRVGGKVKLRDFIIGALPEHNIYVEPFAGSFAVGFGLTHRCNGKYRIVLNDLDKHVWNFFRVLRDHGEEFARRIDLTPYSYHEFDEAVRVIQKEKEKKQWEALDPIEWARLYLTYNRQSMFGKEDGTWCVSRVGENIAMTWANLEPLIKECSKKLKPVYLECDDYRAVAKRWDNEEACFYLDPPYENVEDDFYGVNKEDGFDHNEMARHVHMLKGSVVISYYDSDYIRGLYPDFTVIYKEAAVKSMSKGKKDTKKKGKGTEILLIKKSEYALSELKDGQCY